MFENQLLLENTDVVWEDCLSTFNESITDHNKDYNTGPDINESCNMIIKEEDNLEIKEESVADQLSTRIKEEPVMDELYTLDRLVVIPIEQSMDLPSTSDLPQNNSDIIVDYLVPSEDFTVKEESDLQEEDWRKNFHRPNNNQQEIYELDEGDAKPDQSCGEDVVLKGHRIVDIRYVLNWAMNMQQKHSGVCPTGEMKVLEELEMGLISVITFQCDKCGTRQSYCTEDPRLTTSDLNIRAVQGTLSTGNTYDHLRDLLQSIDVPCMSSELFRTYEMELDAWSSIEDAGLEEKELAIQNGQVGEDGVPWIDVYLEGGWDCCSFENDFNAAAGVGAIIGKRTQKLLFLGVHNKFCTVCARAASLRIESTTHQHKCIKNWDGSLTSMEPDIIVEGFNHSQSMHGLKYRRFIAEDDSSVSLTLKIKNEVIYGAEVTRTSYVNEAAQSFGKLLTDSAKDVIGTAKQLLSEAKIKQMQDFLMRLFFLNADDGPALKVNLENFVKHIYEDHWVCKLNYCRSVGTFKDSLMRPATLYGLPILINGLLKRLIKGPQVIDEETKNRAALYMSLLKFRKGKDLILSKRGCSWAGQDKRSNAINSEIEQSSVVLENELDTGQLSTSDTNMNCGTEQAISDVQIVSEDTEYADESQMLEIYTGKRKRRYTKEQLIKAVQLLKQKQISYRLAAKKFSIPIGTLFTKVHEKRYAKPKTE